MTQPNLKSKLWTELTWRLYGLLPAAADDFLQWRHRYILPFKNLTISIAILRGSTGSDSGHGTLVVAGEEHRIEYMRHRFFEGEPQQELLGKVPLWTLARTLKDLRTSADLTIACIDRLSARIFFDADYLVVPEWIGSLLLIPENTKKHTQRNHSLKEDMRIVHHNQLTSDLTRAATDFELFYHTMYVPFIRKRYGKQGIVRSIKQLRRRFHQGGLIWVRQKGEAIAGGIFQQHNQVVKLIVVGTINGELLPVKAGALTALYLFVINHAKGLGCKFVDFGGCRPSLKDGLLRYKRKWGMKLNGRHDTHHEYLIYWKRLSKPVISFLSNAPLIFRVIFRDNGGLSAIDVIDSGQPGEQAEAWKVYHSNWMPGLQQLYLLATAGWQPGIGAPPQTDLVDATAVGNFDPSTLK